MERSKEMQEFVDGVAKRIFGRTTQDLGCVSCGSLNVKKEDFKDKLSWEEFNISHLCQKCQDETFG